VSALEIILIRIEVGLAMVFVLMPGRANAQEGAN